MSHATLSLSPQGNYSCGLMCLCMGLLIISAKLQRSSPIVSSSVAISLACRPRPYDNRYLGEGSSLMFSQKHRRISGYQTD
ncbi:hypothetical protein BDN70DRAFT_879032 [Pholiota conissans]|uniref:Uncharacterized protein n=1 Tax=Pholiota conissans TaxID=109636 RepID=A0A9P6D0B5_9AGAR|nr:hypothetical protein BDN70DRAFT_879032 [Pholiota conissans]